MHRLISQRKIEANRRNARKSTVPTSPEGKAVANNALKSGISAKSIVLRGESPSPPPNPRRPHGHRTLSEHANSPHPSHLHPKLGLFRKLARRPADHSLRGPAGCTHTAFGYLLN